MRIGELRRVLRQSGVLGEAGGEPTPAELADALWLAALRRADRSAPPAARDSPDGTERSSALEKSARKYLPKRSLLPSVPRPGSPPGSQVYAALPTRGTAAPGVLVSATGEPQLPEALSLARAMRPLRRRVPSATRHVLDEEGTADLRAEQRLWLPALIPDSEPRFDLALVLDDSESMALWGEKVKEFRLLCERIGAFRDIRLWRLSASGDDSHARPVLRSSRSTGIRDERELVDLSGRRLILVITDGVHPWWRPSGPLLPVLARWALASPLAIVQPFPQRLWDRSPLRPVSGEFRPGWPGNGPTIACRTRNGHADGTRSPGSVAVPILELSPPALHRWARIISGASGVTPMPAATLPRESTAEEELPGSARNGNGQSRDRADPARLVREFRAAVSPAAYQLAGYLSAAPLTLPVMRLIQKSMMPATGTAELAEVFLSGLLLKSADTDPLADPERASYVFTAGVRDVLQSTLTRSEALSVLEQVGRYLTGARRGGRPFPVLLHGQPDGRSILAAAEQFPASFGQISGMLLQRIGAPYTAITREPTRPKGAVPDLPDGQAEQGAPVLSLQDFTREGQESGFTGRRSHAAQHEENFGWPLDDTRSYRPANKAEEEFSGAVRNALAGLKEGAELRVIDFDVSGIIACRVTRDENGTPRAAKTTIPAPTLGATEGFYEEHLTPQLGNGRPLIARRNVDEPISQVLELLRASRHVHVYDCTTPAEEHVREAIRAAPLTRAYELVLLSATPDQHLQLIPHPLFPQGAVRGDSTSIPIRCAPADDGGDTVIAVVTRKGSRISPVTVQTAALQPGDYVLTASLSRPGHVIFKGLPSELHTDQRPLPEIARAVLERMVSPQPVHLICMIETSGGTDLLRRRIDLLEQLITGADEPGLLLAVSVVTYGPHSVVWSVSEEPVSVLVWAAASPHALAALRRLADHKPAGEEYSRAAQLECALDQIARLLADHDGRPVLVTAGGRPPHPARLDTRTQIIPCPDRVDWREALARLRSIPGMAFGALRDPKARRDIWNELGRDASGNVDDILDMEVFSAALGLRDRVHAGPFPLALPVITSTEQAAGAEQAHVTKIRSASVEDPPRAASTEPASAGKEQKRPAVGERPLPADTELARLSAPIAVLGATGSGKSTFLAALELAILQGARSAPGGDWQLWSRTPESRHALVSMHTALASEGRFPLPTAGFDTFDWTLSGALERTERARFRTRTLRQRVEIDLKLTDPSGELARPDQIGRTHREELVGHVAASKGILYIFDPIREFNRGDSYDKMHALSMDLIAAAGEDPGFTGRLPQYVAVCVTKLDEPRVFKTAEALGMLRYDPEDPFGFPAVHDSDARELLYRLSEISRKGTGQVLPRLLEQYFRPDRIGYFATSSLGFMLNKRTRRFDPEDTENVFRTASGESVVRGPVHPINVLEPFLWLVSRIASSA